MSEHPTSDLRPPTSGPRRALVTGVTGFIGIHLLRQLLADGVDVTVLVRSTSKLEKLQSLQVRQVTGDVCDAESVRRAVADVDVVYHLAGRIKAWNLADFSRVNVEGVRNVVAACAARETPPVLVSVSSLAAIGPARNNRDPVVETDAPHPVSNYGRSKLAGEQVLSEYATRLPITVVRPPMVFGPDDPGLLVVFKTIRNQRLMLVPAFRGYRFSMVDVRDLGQLLQTAAVRGRRLQAPPDPQATGCYFVSHETCPTYKELGRLIAQSMDRNFVFLLPTPPRGAYLVGAVGELVNRIRREPGFVSIDKVREAIAGSWLCSAERCRAELDYRPSASLQQQLRDTAESYRTNGWM